MSGRKSHACSSCIRKKKKCLCGTNQNRTPRTNQNRSPRTAVRPKRARHNGVKYTPTTILRDHASFFFNTESFALKPAEKRKKSRAREARRMERQKTKQKICLRHWQRLH